MINLTQTVNETLASMNKDTEINPRRIHHSTETSRSRASNEVDRSVAGVPATMLAKRFTPQKSGRRNLPKLSPHLG